MTNRLAVTALTSIILLLSIPASATLIGDTVDLSNQDGPITSFGVAAGGPDYTLQETEVGFCIVAQCTGSLAIDIEESSITVTLLTVWDEQQWNEFTLSDLDWTDTPGRITDVTFEVDPHLLTSTVPFSIVAFGDDFVTFDMPLGFAGSDLGTAVINLETEHASVPEPTTLALLSLGLAGLGVTRRRKKA